MTQRESELAARGVGPDLVNISRSLREAAAQIEALADRLEPLQLSDTEIELNRRHRSPEPVPRLNRRHRSPDLGIPRDVSHPRSHYQHVEGEIGIRHVNVTSPERYDYRSQHRRADIARTPNHASSILRSDPLEDGRSRKSVRSEPRVGWHEDSDQLDYANSIQSLHSPPPSPSPLSYATRQPAVSRSRTLEAVHNGDARHQPASQGLPLMQDNDPLGDIYNLDETLVLCSGRHKPKIHRPPHGESGSQGRWYYVRCGREVGIFNEWDDVQHATSGVSGSHQQRTPTEAVAYRKFKQALLDGRVRISE